MVPCGPSVRKAALQLPSTAPSGAWSSHDLARVCLSPSVKSAIRLLQISAVQALNFQSSWAFHSKICVRWTQGKLCSAGLNLVAVQQHMLLHVLQVRHLRSRSSLLLGRLHELALALEGQV